MKIIKIISFVLLSGPVFSCFCFVVPFCEVTQQAGNVIEVKVLNQYIGPDGYQQFVDFEVKEVLLSDILSIPTYITAAQRGNSCDIALHHYFKKGDIFFLAMSEIYTDTNANFPTINIPYCGTSFLKKSFGKVSGNITEVTNERKEQIPYLKFKRSILNLCSIETIENSISIGTNPISTFPIVKNDLDESLEYQVYNASGILIRKGTIEGEEEKEIEMNSYPAAIYILVISNGKERVTKKLVKAIF